MEIKVLTIRNTRQAKLTINNDHAIIKIPNDLPFEQKVELRGKLLSIANLNIATKEPLKLYYKPNTPYFFLNKKIGFNKKETVRVYRYDEL
jgi:hypothetical protein